MKNLIYILILFLIFPEISKAQFTELVYLKTQPGKSPLRYQPTDSVYTWIFTDPGESVDLSILPNGAPYEINTGYYISPVVYDFNLNPIHSFKIAEGTAIYDFTKKLGDKYMFVSSPQLSAEQGAASQFTTIPPLSGNYPGSYFSNYNTLLYNTGADPILTMPFQFTWYYPDIYNANPHPIPHFKDAIQFYGQDHEKAAYVSDGHIITTHTMLDDVVLNWEDTISSGNNQWGTLWLKINPTTGDYIATPILSNNGSVIPLTVFPSENNDFIYRTGTLRGHNLQVSPDGSIWENSAQDSLYHTFIVKENANGEQEWIRELFAYNDTWSDVNPPQSGIFYIEKTPSLIELNNNIYLSNSIHITSVQGDSLYFRDFDGMETFHYPPEDYVFEYGYLAVAARTVYQIDEQGAAVNSLRQPLKFYNQNDLNYFHTRSEPYLFKVKDVLGWSNTYRSHTDTTVYFLKNDLNGTIDSMAVDLPAGKGAYILWLDSELNILETTNIPFTSADYNLGVQITDATLFHNDTLLLMGTIRNGTTTSLDPEGQAEDINYSGYNSFVGFYTLPSVLSTNVKKNAPAVSLNIYPNPGNNLITVKSEFLAGSDYEVYDLTGRIVLKGDFSNSNSAVLNIEKLGSGMYILKINGADGGSVSEKFLKE